MTTLSFIGRKTQQNPPYAVITAMGGTWTYKVLKRYSKDDAAQYARWFVTAETPHTFGSADMGDTYVADVLDRRTMPTLVEVAGRVPTAEELAEFSSLMLAL